MHSVFFAFLQVLLAVSVIGKGYLHTYIAYRNNIKLGAGGGLPFKTLWYFTKPVQSDDESLKKTCNYLQRDLIFRKVVDEEIEEEYLRSKN